MNIKAEYIVGKNSGNDWSGFYGYIPDVTSDVKTELFCVIRLKTDAEDVELERIAGMLLDEFQDAYYTFPQGEDEIVKLEESFQKMKAKLEVIVSREDTILEKGLDIEMTIALVNDEILIVGVIGESKILIYRNNKLVDITKGLVDANMLGFVKTGSLNLDSKDRVVLSTSIPFTILNDELVKSVENLNINNLQSIGEQKGSAVLIFGDESLEWNQSDPESELPEQLPEPEDATQIGEFIEEHNQVVEMNPEGEEFSENLSIDEIMPENSQEKLSQNSSNEDISTSTVLPSPLQNRISGLKSKVPMLGSKLAALGRRSAIKNDSDSQNSKDFEDEDEEINEVLSETSIFNKIKSNASNLKNKFRNNSSASPLKTPNFNEDKTYKQIIYKIFMSLRKYLLKAINFIKTDIIGIGANRLDMRRNAERLKRNRLIAGVVLILFILLIYFAWKDADLKRQEAEQIQLATSKISQLETEINQAIGQVETVKSQDQTKKDILENKLNNLATSVQEQKKAGYFTDSLDKLKTKINNALDSLDYIKEVNDNNIALVSDIGRLFSDNNLSDIAFANGQLYASDKKRNVIYKIGTSLNSDAQELVKNLTSPELLVRDAENNIIVYDSDASSGIGIINTQSGDFSRLAGLSPALTGTVNEVAIYGNNDALYELHQNNQQIFKRDKLGNSYTGGGAVYVSINPPNWRTDPEFAKAIDISVPYEIYVLIEGQGIKRYLAGGNNTLTYETYENFSQSDFDSFRNAKALDIDNQYMAVADPLNKRVMVFEIIDDEQKSVKFIEQFIYRGSDTSAMTNIKELAVDSSTNTIYVLDGSKILKLTI